MCRDKVTLGSSKLNCSRQYVIKIINISWFKNSSGNERTSGRTRPILLPFSLKRAFRCSAPAVWNSLPQTVLSSDSVAVFKLRLQTFLSPRLSPLSLLTSTLPGPSASEVTTLWRYTNLLIIIIIIICSTFEVQYDKSTSTRTTAIGHLGQL